MILPFQTLRYTTSMRPDEVVSVLRANVGEPPKWFKKPPERYIGSVDNYRFNIRRNIGGRNSFLPMLRGTIAGAPAGTEIRVQFRIHPAVLLFCVIWESFVLAGPLLVAFGFSGFLILLICIGFGPESTNAEQDLKGMVPPIPDYSITEVPQLR